MKRCPICGAMSFCVTAHVTQDWVVDENGNFIRSLNDCVEVTHFPDDNDIWDCYNCGYSAPGKDFNVNEAAPSNRIVYSCDVGVLLTPEDDDYPCYSQVYDRKHGYYDEEQTGYLDKDEAIAYGKKYVEDGIEGTYAVISNQGCLYRGAGQDFDKNNIEGFTYNIENVIYSCRKINGKIEENFVQFHMLFGNPAEIENES